MLDHEDDGITIPPVPVSDPYRDAVFLARLERFDRLCVRVFMAAMGLLLVATFVRYPGFN